MSELYRNNCYAPGGTRNEKDREIKGRSRRKMRRWKKEKNIQATNTHRSTRPAMVFSLFFHAAEITRYKRRASVLRVIVN